MPHLPPALSVVVIGRNEEPFLPPSSPRPHTPPGRELPEPPLRPRSRGEHFRTAVEYVASGKLRKVRLIRAWITQRRGSIGNPPDGTPSPGIDYDVWLGLAPKRPFNPNRFHYNWRFFWDYGSTELGNQGVHMLEVAMWSVEKMRGIDNRLPKRIGHNGGIYWLDDAKEAPDTQVVTYDYGDLMLVWEMHSFQQLQRLHEEPEETER